MPDSPEPGIFSTSYFSNADFDKVLRINVFEGSMLREDLRTLIWEYFDRRKMAGNQTEKAWAKYQERIDKDHPTLTDSHYNRRAIKMYTMRILQDRYTGHASNPTKDRARRAAMRAKGPGHKELVQHPTPITRLRAAAGSHAEAAARTQGTSAGPSVRRAAPRAQPVAGPSAPAVPPAPAPAPASESSQEVEPNIVRAPATTAPIAPAPATAAANATLQDPSATPPAATPPPPTDIECILAFLRGCTPPCERILGALLSAGITDRAALLGFAYLPPAASGAVLEHLGARNILSEREYGALVRGLRSFRSGI